MKYNTKYTIVLEIFYIYLVGGLCLSLKGIQFSSS